MPSTQHNLTHLTIIDKWPTNPLTIITEILGEPSLSPRPTRFKFEILEGAAEHNWETLSEDIDLGHALTHNGRSPLNTRAQEHKST